MIESDTARSREGVAPHTTVTTQTLVLTMPLGHGVEYS